MKIHNSLFLHFIRKPRVFLSLLFAFAALAVNAQERISTVEQLNDIRTNLAGSYKLVNDIDLTGQAWTPIGDEYNAFTGSFDGGGFTIKGLTINPGKHYVGLFGVVNTSGSIQNLTVEVADDGITGKDYVGALVGVLRSGSVSSCFATGGKVVGAVCVGGLIGQQFGTLTDSYATVDVEGNNHVGGLIGKQFGTITGCFATGAVTAIENNAGGLVGTLDIAPSEPAGKLTHSYATGTVTIKRTNCFIGGLVGYQFLDIDACYATGEVNSDLTQSAGGLVGFRMGGSITSSYFNTETTGMSEGVGYVYNPETTNNLEGLDTEEMQTADSYEGWDIGTGSSATWSIDPVYNGGYPYLTATNQLVEIYTQEDLAKLYSLGTGSKGKGCYFKLMNDITLNMADGQPGTNGAGWIPVGDQTNAFTASFDGGGFTIKGLEINLTATNAEPVGLFGVIKTSGSIKNLTVEVGDAGITGVDYVGALAGVVSDGILSSCFATGGEVKGVVSVGGLIGQQNGTLADSYATVKVEGKANVGGLAGEQNGTITGCFATGAVTATDDLAPAGGLVGLQTATAGKLTHSYATGTVTARGDGVAIGGLVGCQNMAIDACYATGQVNSNGAPLAGGLVGKQENGSITTSYYNTETTGMTEGVGGISDATSSVGGLGTEEMIVATNYTGWTISAPGSGSAADPWVINTRTYPYLYWQKSHIVTIPEKTPPVVPPVPETPHRVMIPKTEGIGTSPQAGEIWVTDGASINLTFWVEDTHDQSEVYLVINGDSVGCYTNSLRAGSRMYSYRITQITSHIHIEFHGVKENTPTGNITPGPAEEAVTVWTIPGHVVIESLHEQPVSLYTLSGALVNSCRIASGITTIPLSKGVYLAVVGKTIVKVIVR